MNNIEVVNPLQGARRELAEYFERKNPDIHDVDTQEAIENTLDAFRARAQTGESGESILQEFGYPVEGMPQLVEFLDSVRPRG